MARCAVAAGLGFCTPPSVVTASAPSSPFLRSTFFSPCLSSGALNNSQFPLRRRRHPPLRKRLARISSSAIPTGIDTQLHESMVHLQVGLLQKVVNLGFALPTNDRALSWLAIAVPALLWYVAAVPGTLSGLLDYAYAPVHSLSNQSFDAEEVQVGRQIGQGSFGIVYEGYIGRGLRKGSQKEVLHVVLKKVKPRVEGAAEMHDAEVHMNRRVQRTAPSACADFLGTTEVSSSQIHGRLSKGLWLVWRYEGDKTLAQYMQQKNFPDNVAELILGSKLAGASKQEIVDQSNAVIRKIAAQVLTCLRDLHKTGLVHRDVKPMNLILAQDSGTFKFIDLGAAVDLRSGYNYVPDETILDLTYAAPEHHVMPISTPQLPPDPLCSVVSPLVWLLNTPDRFDLYSAGLVLLQMAVKPLRQDIGLQAFNAEFKRAGYNLDAWRRRCRFSKEEFALLDADGAAGWELVRSMLQLRHDRDFFIWPSLGSSRPSADAALRHRFLTKSSIKLPSLKDLDWPKFSFPLEPSKLIPKFSFDSFPLQPRHLIPKFDFNKRPVFSFPFEPKNLVPNFSFDNLPAFSFPLEPSKLIPKFNFASLRKPGAVGTGLDMNVSQVLKTINAITPVATTSALTLATGWLVLSALKDSAQTSYAIGKRATEFLGISGAIGLTSFVFIRLLLEAQESKRSSNNTDSKLRTSQTSSLAAVDTGVPMEVRINDALPTSQQKVVKERMVLSAPGEAMDTSDHIPVEVMVAAKVESPLEDTKGRELLTSRPQTLRLKHTRTGLTEAVQIMELQLASLESSIAAGRLFSQQQQQQIARMEKLLKQRPREAVAPTEQSPT